MIPSEGKAKTINRYPLAVLVGVVCTLMTYFISKAFDSTADRSADCMEQVMYLRERVTKLEQQLDEYTTANMIQRGVITKLADSLATKKEGI